MRRTLILVHLWVAAFATPAIIMLATSGGLYLFGIKGEVIKTEIVLPAGTELDFSAVSLDRDVEMLLAQLSIEQDYEYLKNRGSAIQTRPTSRTHLEFTQKDGVLRLTRNNPNLQGSMIELHKGHGPKTFKLYQQLVAISLIIVLLSGVWVGLINPTLRRKTGIGLTLGLVVFLLLAFS